MVLLCSVHTFWNIVYSLVKTNVDDVDADDNITAVGDLCE